MTTTTTTRRRGARSASAGLRLRRLIFFLSRNRLYRTVHTVERKTCVFFDTEHLRRMMFRDRWAAASSYALSFVNYRDCSREADELNYRILALRVLAAFAAGQARSIETLFRRIFARLRFKPDRDRIAIRRLLLAMRSDDTKSSRLYGRFKPRAVQGIMDLAAKCPELKTKTHLPRYMSLGHHESWRNTPKNHQKKIKLPIFQHETLPVPFCQKGLILRLVKRLVTRRIVQMLQVLHPLRVFCLVHQHQLKCFQFHPLTTQLPRQQPEKKLKSPRRRQLLPRI